MTPTAPATPITEATFPKRELEALAEYFEHIVNSWLTLGDSSSAVALQRETMENALMLRRAIASHALTQRQLRELTGGPLSVDEIDAADRPPF